MWGWLWNCTNSLEVLSLGALFIFKVIGQFFKVVRGLKSDDLDPFWVIPDSNFTLNLGMAMKSFKQLGRVEFRCLFDFQGHWWIFKVRRGSKIVKFSRSNIELAISRPKMVRLLRNEKQTYRLDVSPKMGAFDLTLIMTLTLNFQGQT